MRISRVELTDYKCFDHLVLDGIGDRVVLVGPNGCGKSTVLEAIAVAKEYVGTYQENKGAHTRAITPGRYRPGWPAEVPVPVRAGRPQAVVRVRLAFSVEERQRFPALPADGVDVTVTVLRDGEVQSEAPDPVRELFQYYDPDASIGVVDYIGADRVLPPSRLRQLDIGSLSPARQGQERIELPRAAGQPSQKFATIKQYIAGQQLGDLSRSQATGTQVDSLALLRELFARFFAPKKLLGAAPGAGELQVLVSTPYGEHDIDLLSSGEKELFSVLVNLFRIRDLPAVVLYDEPERHLNAGLEAKLIPALDALNTRNQLFVASHGLELIGSVPLEQIVALRTEASRVVPARYDGAAQTARVRLLEDLGATVGLQLSSRRVVFVEGKEAHADKRILDRLLGAKLPGVVFVASGSSKGVLGAATRAGLLIESAGVNAAVRLLLDRDYRSEADAATLRSRLSGRAFVWAAHEVENLLLAPRHLLTILHRSGVAQIADEDAVLRELRGCAEALAERFACELAAYRVNAAGRGAGDAGGTEERESGRPIDEAGYRAMAGAALERSTKAYAPQVVADTLTAARAEVATALAGEAWLQLLPGKEILEEFRRRHLTGAVAMSADLLKEQVVSAMVEADDVPADARALITFVDAT